MATEKYSKTWNAILWALQVILAVNFLWASWMKLGTPVSQVAAMWPWAGQVSVGFLKFTGVVDLLGALGLILPALTRIKPSLTPITALCIIALMVCASIFHISREEGSQIGFNIFVLIIAAAIAWGRFNKVPIEER